jgi:3-oxocholest-4-en-26-oyl-CoA dehydrogenase beta subunit
MIDFSFSEQQAAVTTLAGQIFADFGKPDQLAAAEAADGPLNQALWTALAESGLLGVWLSEDAGGGGGGLLELCAALGVQGRYVVHAPLLPAAVGAMFADRFLAGHHREALLAAAAGGAAIIVPALAEHGAALPVAPGTTATAAGGGAVTDPGAAVTVTGGKISVAGGPVATHFLVPVLLGDGQPGVALVARDAAGLTVTPARTSDRDQVAHLDLAGTPATLAGLAGSVEWLYQRCVTALCALQWGVLAAAAEQAASYTSARTQFGKPLTYFQTVLKRGADAYMDTRAVRLTMWHAAWLLDRGEDAAQAVAIAKWWTSEAGHRVAHSSLYLHGGIGNDITYPAHRYYLWARQIDATLGGPSQQLERLGDELARN